MRFDWADGLYAAGSALVATGAGMQWGVPVGLMVGGFLLLMVAVLYALRRSE